VAVWRDAGRLARLLIQEGRSVTIPEDVARSELRGLLERVKELAAQGAKIGEANVKAILIENYLRLLGYDVLADVEREYFIKAAKEYMDFLLKVDGRPVIAVEVKDLNVDLSAHVTQLANYANAEGIRWCILTNAQEIRVYDQHLPGKPAEKLVLKVELTRFANDTEYGAVFKDFWRLSKDNMKTEQALKEVVGEARLDAAMRTILADTGSSAFKALRKGVQATLERKVSHEEIQMWLSTRLGTTAPSGQGTPSGGEQPAQPPRFEPFLKQMIQRGIIPANVQVSAEYGGQEHTAVIDAEGWLSYKGERIRKPGSAAKRITGEPTDGFEFWKYQGVPLARLRDKLWQK